MIGEKLKELRKKHNLTQQQISEILDIKQNTYSGYENDKYEPDLETIIKIANYYNTSIDFLLGRYKR